MLLKEFIENNPDLCQDEIEYYSKPIIAQENHNCFWMYDYDTIVKVQDISKETSRFFEYVSLYKVNRYKSTHEKAVEYAFNLMKPSKDDYDEEDCYCDPLVAYEVDMNILYAIYDKAMSNE